MAPISDVVYPRIAFFGPMASGKTFLAQHLVKYYEFTKVALADELKETAKHLFDVEGKDGRAREVYQQLGESLRKIDPDVWLNALKRRIGFLEELYGTDVSITVDDVRYKNEYETLKAAGFTMIRVWIDDPVRLERISRLYPHTTTEALTHISEIDLEGYPGDFSISSYNDIALDELDRIIWDKLG